jgi:ribosome-binding protein aMBF1 (putative translation factor)
MVLSTIFMESNARNVMEQPSQADQGLAARPRRPKNQEVPTAEQIRAARALLGWSAAELARRARVSKTTLANCERGSGIPRAQTATLERIRQTLEDANVEFISGGNGPGVRLRGRRS